MGLAVIVITVGTIVVGPVEPLPHLGSLTAGLHAPARLAVAPDESILVTDSHHQHVARFEADGTLAGIWPIPEGPAGVAVHPDGRVFVSVRQPPGVAVYDSAMNFLAYLGAGKPDVQFAGPTDISIAQNTGRIFVADAEGDGIYAFDWDGTLVLKLGARGTLLGRFIFPSAVAVDELHGRFIVADHDNWRIQIFTTQGVFLAQFGDRKKSTSSGSEGWMPRPSGVAVDPVGNIYVADALMSTVRVFDPTGSELGKVVDYGYDAGSLRVACDLALSRDGSRLYVVNTNGSRVEVYDTSGVLARSTYVEAEPLTGALPAEPGPVRAAVDDEPMAAETAWNGPHLVEDRVNVCWPCHGIAGQPGGHGGTVEGQGMLCMSCHTAGGRAAALTIHEADMADPFASNPAAADGLGGSHAWGVPAVNPDADAVGPAPGSVMLQYLDGDGNIKCATCHNQHNTDNGLYLRVDNTGDAMCKECHAPRNRGLGQGGSHPVGIAFPYGEGEYPPDPATGDVLIKDGMVECMTCHAPHNAFSGGVNAGRGDGTLLRIANDETLCQTCHTEHSIHLTSTDWQPSCNDCHDMHDVDSDNLSLIARQIDGVATSFAGADAGCNDQGDYIHSTCSPPSFDGVCEVCHTQTAYHANAVAGDHDHYSHRACTLCHQHDSGFLVPDNYCAVCHGEPPDGSVSPNLAGSHGVHLMGVNGPHLSDCESCHASVDAQTHDNGMVTFASGVDVNGDGEIDLAEADVCDACHGRDGPIDGVNDPLIGAKANWVDGVYDGDVLRADRTGWCAGCHDEGSATVNGVEAPEVAGDSLTWGDGVSGHGRHLVACTECHDPTLSHTDGVAKTFSDRFPLLIGGLPKPAEERELDREAYNNAYRLRRRNGERALEIPRDLGDYNANDFALCFDCHDELELMGVPANYESLPFPPLYLQLPEGVPQTNYRNELDWGFGWASGHTSQPVNAHWRHSAIMLEVWDIDHDGLPYDSMASCVTCHNPHGARRPNGEPTVAMTVGDLDIGTGIFDDGETKWEYGFIGSDEFFSPGGDLHCLTCHPMSGQGEDPPAPPEFSMRYYRTWLELPPEQEGD